MKQGKKWTQAEKDYVREHYKERGALVARDLDRSLASVQKYARMLGVAEKRSYSQQLFAAALLEMQVGDESD